MPDLHPSRDTLEQFLLGDLDSGQAREVVIHLLSECPECRAVTDSGWRHIQQGLASARRDIEPTEVCPGGSYSAALERAIEQAAGEAAALDRQRRDAEGLFEKLLDHPQPRRLTRVLNSPRFQTPELCALLIDRSFEARFSDARAGVEMAEVAVAVAQKLEPGIRSSRDIHDLSGRAWAYLGNARRVASDLDGADEALQQASHHFEEGMHDGLDRALLCRFNALLLRAQRRFDEADQLQARAVRLYRELGESALAAHTLSDQATGNLYAGQPQRAIPLFQQALAILKEQPDTRKIAVVQHNLALCLIDTGQHREAQRMIRGLHSIYQELGDRLSLIRLRWLEGKVYCGLELEGLAEEALVEARNAFVEEGIAYDAALVCLDLAALLAGRGRTTEMRRLAGEMMPIFESQDLHREALAALVMFRDAALAERLTLTLVQSISAYLQEARNNPTLRFRQA